MTNQSRGERADIAHRQMHTRGSTVLKVIAISALLCLAPVAVHAEDISPADSKAIDARVDALFKEINAGHTDAALNANFLSRMATDNKQALQALSVQMQAAIGFVGLPMKTEMISQNEIASVLVERTYVAYAKDMPVRFRFIFFKTSDGWYLQSLFFDDFKAQDY